MYDSPSLLPDDFDPWEHVDEIDWKAMETVE